MTAPAPAPALLQSMTAVASTSSHQVTAPSTATTLESKAKMISDLKACGQRLRDGELVAFPTETVYGLGCHALDEKAIYKVFQAKERPLSDPLIVHVLSKEEAFDLWHATTATTTAKKPIGEQTTTTTTTPVAAEEGRILSTLCEAFWPGPLTLVARACSIKVPALLTANTGYVAVRSPSHPLARALLEESQVPLGAPSANKFGHVSPTTAQHVWDDLQHENVWILVSKEEEEEEEGKQQQQSSAATTNANSCCCEVGVESTVAKLQHVDHVVTVNGNEYSTASEAATFSSSSSSSSLTGTRAQFRLQVLRQGKVSVQDLRECLRQANLHDSVIVESIQRATAEDAVNVAPGQTLRHYSPRIPSFLVSSSLSASLAESSSSSSGSYSNLLTPCQQQKVRQSVVVDYGARLAAWKDVAYAYRDLCPPSTVTTSSAAGTDGVFSASSSSSSSSSSTQAAQFLFETLRWAEQQPVQRIYFPALDDNDSNNNNENGVRAATAATAATAEPQDGSNSHTTNGNKNEDALLLAIKDRLTRAASGVVISNLDES